MAGIYGDKLQQLCNEVSRIRDQLKAVDETVTRGERARQFVVNEDSRVVHLPISCHGPTRSWGTRRGWQFALSTSAVVRPDPPATWPRCATCFRGAEVATEAVEQLSEYVSGPGHVGVTLCDSGVRRGMYYLVFTQRCVSRLAQPDPAGPHSAELSSVPCKKRCGCWTEQSATVWR